VPSAVPLTVPTSGIAYHCRSALFSSIWYVPVAQRLAAAVMLKL